MSLDVLFLIFLSVAFHGKHGVAAENTTPEERFLGGLGGARPPSFVDARPNFPDVRPPTVDGIWTPWSSWSRCSATCRSPLTRDPTQSRTRVCTPPLYGGKQCRGRSQESRSCNTIRCPERCCTDSGCYEDGESWPIGDRGATCTCSDGNSLCTGVPRPERCCTESGCYEDGESWPIGDRGATCTCSNGNPQCHGALPERCCTESGCYEDGETWPIGDRGATCTCSNGKYQCTGVARPERCCTESGCYEDGESWPIGNLGTTCTCSNGKSLCTGSPQPDYGQGKPWCKGRNFPGGRECCEPEDPYGSKCTEGQGDCDSDAGCAGDLVCGKDNCWLYFEAHPDDDCCTKP